MTPFRTLIVALLLVFSGQLRAQIDTSHSIDSVIQQLVGDWLHTGKRTGHSSSWLDSTWYGYQGRLTLFQTHQDSLDQAVSYWYFHDDSIVDIGRARVIYDTICSPYIVFLGNIVNEKWPSSWARWRINSWYHPDTVGFYGNCTADGCTYYFARIPPPTSVQEVQQEKGKLSAWPNPVTNLLNLQWNGQPLNKGRLSLLNIMGQTVWQNESMTGSIVDMSAFPTGIYLLQYQARNGQKRTIRIKKAAY